MRAALLVLLVACGGSGSSRPPDAGPCRTDDQCVLSDIKDRDDCCGALCWARYPYHVDDLAHLERERAARCKDHNGDECAVAECLTKPPMAARCQAGDCVLITGELIEIPGDTRCLFDTDCAHPDLEPSPNDRVRCLGDRCVIERLPR